MVISFCLSLQPQHLAECQLIVGIEGVFVDLNWCELSFLFDMPCATLFLMVAGDKVEKHEAKLLQGVAYQVTPRD